MQSIDAAIQEMTFARKELGFRGGFLRPNPYNDRKLHDPDYEPFWSAAEELDFCIGMHEVASLFAATISEPLDELGRLAGVADGRLKYFVESFVQSPILASRLSSLPRRIS